MAELTGTTAFDWNFNALLDAEVLPACYYEYARESATILECLEVASDASLPQTQRYHQDFHETVRQQAVTLHLILQEVDGIRRPWQSLSKAKRKAICDRVIEYQPNVGLLRWLPFNRIVDFRKMMGEEGVPQSDYLPELDSQTGIERLGVEIDWGNYQNSEIAATFKVWLEANRPPAFAESVTRGKKQTDWRARIERLGLLRLRSRHSFAEARPFLARLSRIAKNTDSGECNREAKKAVADFHNLFPFLDPMEVPRSWPIR